MVFSLSVKQPETWIWHNLKTKDGSSSRLISEYSEWRTCQLNTLKQMMGLKIKRMLWYNREFVILSPPFIVLQPCSFLYFDRFLAILCQNNVWFALRRKSLCFWSWYRKCVLSTLDSQFFFWWYNHCYKIVCLNIWGPGNYSSHMLTIHNLFDH